jgi:hypothetical protein
MKSLPVYNLGQWIKTGTNIGRIVARNVDDDEFGHLSEFANNAHVQHMSNRGAGYAIQWVQLNYELPIAPADKSIGYTPRRLCWIRAETIAEKRYQPCECPIAPKVAEAPKEAQVDLPIQPKPSERPTVTDEVVTALWNAVKLGDEARALLESMGAASPIEPGAGADFVDPYLV